MFIKLKKYFRSYNKFFKVELRFLALRKLIARKLFFLSQGSFLKKIQTSSDFQQKKNDFKIPNMLRSVLGHHGRQTAILFHLLLLWHLIVLLSQRESFKTVKFFDGEISMTFDISELPESKYAFSGKSLCVRARVCVRMQQNSKLDRYQVHLWQVYCVYFEVVQVQLYS